jgi:hypothetical protein
MRTNSIFIVHAAEAIGSPLGGRGWRSGPPRFTPWPRCGTRTGHGLGNSPAEVQRGRCHVGRTRLRQVTWPAVADHRDYIVGRSRPVAREATAIHK